VGGGYLKSGQRPEREFAHSLPSRLSPSFLLWRDFLAQELRNFRLVFIYVLIKRFDRILPY
jgi:hypothetical protein